MTEIPAGRFVRVAGDQVPLSRLETKAAKGLILVISGHGKGKTTTALGLARKLWKLSAAALRRTNGDED